MKTLKGAIQELKNSKLIPSDANEFKSRILIKQLLSYSCNKEQNFYRALSLISGKTPLQIKYLEWNDFHSFYTVLKKATSLVGEI